MRPVLVTGGSGALGRQLISLLLERGDDVTALARTVPAVDAQPAATWLEADLRHEETIDRALARLQPAVIFHLAGARGGSHGDLTAINVAGLSHLIGALARRGLRPRVIIAGSSAQYGLRQSSAPVAETEALRAESWYGATKNAQEALAFGAFRASGLETIAARLFNLIGPGQRAGLIAADIALQLVDPGTTELVVGATDGVRDFVDYRDAARALLLLAETGEPGRAYNVASGSGTPIRSIIETLLERSLRNDLAIVERTAPGQAPGGQLIGDATALADATGWAPRHALDESLADQFDVHARDWRDSATRNP